MKNKNSFKKIYLTSILLVVAIVGTVLVMRLIPGSQVLAAVSDPANLKLVSTKTVVEVGEEITIDLSIESPVRDVTAADIIIKFPSEYFEITDIESGGALPELIGAANIDLDNGTLTMARGSLPGNLFKGNGIIAQISFKGIKSSNNTAKLFSIDPGTRVSGKGTETQNLLGTVSSLSVKVNSANFTTTLKGENEVPSVTTSANGTASLKLNDAETSFTVNLDLVGITNQTSAHIHGPADEGENASPLYTLPNGDLTNHTFQSSRLATGVTMDQLVQVLKDGTAYVNIHTNTNPNGEIRGQLLTSWMRDSAQSFLRSDFTGGPGGAKDGRVTIQDLNQLYSEFYKTDLPILKANIATQCPTSTPQCQTATIVDIQDYNIFTTDWRAYLETL